MYHILRSGIDLVSNVGNLVKARNEGNVEALSAMSKLGRFQSLAAMNFSYSRIMEKKVDWLSRTCRQTL